MSFMQYSKALMTTNSCSMSHLCRYQSLCHLVHLVTLRIHSTTFPLSIFGKVPSQHSELAAVDKDCNLPNKVKKNVFAIKFLSVTGL